MKPEVAYLITGIEAHNIGNVPGSNVNLGGSYENLKRAVEVFTSQCNSGDNMFAGEIQFKIKNEKTGEVDTAIVSITNQELFLTVPAQVHDHSTIIHGRSHLADRYPDGCMVEENPTLR